MKPLVKHELAGETWSLQGASAAIETLGSLRQANLADMFRAAMRELASGVSLVTTGQGVRRAGLTATSVTSLSASPPSLLVSVQRTSHALAAIRDNAVFAVNFLNDGQRVIADGFSGRAGLAGADRFATGDWRDGTLNVPVLASALSVLECRISQVVDWHTHSVLFAEVAAIAVRGEGDALVYWRGAYRSLAAGEVTS